MLDKFRRGQSLTLGTVLAAAAATVCISLPAALAQDANTDATLKKDNDSRTRPQLPPEPVAVPDRAGDKFSFSGGLDFSSHFISFGADVWGGGDEYFPFSARSTTFAYGTVTAKFSDELSGFVNLWSDLNDNTDSGIGGPVQEIDFNVGFTYTVDKWTFGLTHNYWMFNGDEEKAIEASVGYNDMGLIAEGFALNPSLLAHYRYDGLGGQETGWVLQLGVRPTFTFNAETDYPITLAVPAAVGFFTDSYQGGDAGFGYANVGVSASVPLAFIPTGYGNWTAGVSATLWYTPEDQIPGNPEETFVVTAATIGVAF
jgi:hypothetical protein